MKKRDKRKRMRKRLERISQSQAPTGDGGDGAVMAETMRVVKELGQPPGDCDVPPVTHVGQDGRPVLALPSEEGTKPRRLRSGVYESRDGRQVRTARPSEPVPSGEQG